MVHELLEMLCMVLALVVLLILIVLHQNQIIQLILLLHNFLIYSYQQLNLYLQCQLEEVILFVLKNNVFLHIDQMPL